ncbi:hypothetical protein JHK87_055803 [Glycine soja]|nr:hypothetical protein JHK87_055803 [Glycine soja]
MERWRNIEFKEEEKVIFEALNESEDATDAEIGEAWFVGKVHTQGSFNSKAFMTTMAHILKVKGGVEIKEVGGNLFTFKFPSKSDMKKVLGREPWDVDAKDEDVDNFPYGVWLKASPMEMNVVVGVKTEVSFSSARRKLSCDAMDKGSPGDHLARNEGELKNGKHSEREPQLIKVSEVLKSLVECHIEKEEQLSIIRVDERILGLKEAEKIVPKVVICSGELMINYVEKTKVVQGKKDDETVFKRKN